MKTRAVTVSILLLGFALIAPPVQADDDAAAADSSRDADEFSDFRIPRHHWHSLQGTLAGAFFGDRAHAVAGLSDATQRDHLWNGQVGGSFASSMDSDASRFAYRLSLLLTGDRQDRSGDLGAEAAPDFHYAQHTEEHLRDGIELWQAGIEARRYPSRFTVIARANGSGAYAEARTNLAQEGRTDSPGSATRTEIEIENLIRDYRHQASGELSLGWGRVRDATAVYAAWLLEHRLLESGALARPLSREAREKIAALYYIQPDYSVIHDRPARFFWREVERTLREDGALSERGAGSYEWMYVLESYVSGFPTGLTPLLRQTGFFAGFTVSGEHVHEFRRTDSVMNQQAFVEDSLVFVSSSDSRTDQTFSSDQALWGGEAEYHRPIGIRWQFDARTTALVPIQHPDHGLRLYSSATLGYLIADRWFATGYLKHQRLLYRKPTEPPSSWTFGYGASVGFYVEDRTRLSLTADWTQDEQVLREPLYPPARNYASYARITLVLAHQFLGRLEAPGLIEPQGLLPTSSPY